MGKIWNAIKRDVANWFEPKPPYSDLADVVLYGARDHADARLDTHSGPSAAERYSSDGKCRFPAGPPSDPQEAWEYGRFCHRGRAEAGRPGLNPCTLCLATEYPAAPADGAPTPLQRAMRAADRVKPHLRHLPDYPTKGRPNARGAYIDETGHLRSPKRQVPDPALVEALGEFVRPGELPAHAREPATPDRADTLAAAIAYALDYERANGDGIGWLRSWNEGDPEAMAELSAAVMAGEIS